nr:MBG domain-containing protein [Polaromonas vacuolata]
MAGDGLLNVTVDTGAVNAMVGNTGLIQADGGKVFLTTHAATGLLNTVVNNTGLIQAQTLENHKGRIVLLGDMKNGTVHVGGTLDASAPNGGDGGFIETSAARVKISNNASITTKAANGKTGEWLIDPVDFTIAASGGDMTGADLSTDLSSTNVSISSTSGATGTLGNLNVNDAVSWSTNKLTLTAVNDVNINAVMTATGAASLELNPTGKVNVALGVSGFTGSVDFSNLNPGALTIKGFAQTVITNQAGLQSMGNSPATLSGRYVLGNNINLGGSFFNPIGNAINSFNGSLDGLGHTVSNLSINPAITSYVGLFGFVAAQGDIRNIGIVNSNITTGASYVGALAGYSNASIANSYSSTNVTAANYVGGLVGVNIGAINQSFVTGSVNGSFYVGGLTGYNNVNATINNSYATGSVLASSNYAGGLTGVNEGSVRDSYATGSTYGVNYVGGLVGYTESRGSIDMSYATGSVKGVSYVGGLIGYNKSSSTINNSYATGSVLASSNYAGGLIGNNYGAVINSYASGFVSGTSSVGGLIGSNQNSLISNNYWKINETNPNQLGIGSGISTGATGLTAAQMTDEFKFTGFNFTQPIWGFATGVNNDQPILCAVSACSVTVYVNPTAGTNVYGTAPVFAYKLVDRNGASYSLNNASLNGTATNTSTAPTKFSDVDNYTFRYASGYGLSGTDASNYVLKAWKTPTNWTVTPAYLTITPDNLSRLYGEVNPDLTYKVSGFVNGESLSTPNIGSPLLTTTAMPTTSVGNVSINVTVNDLGARNYRTTGLNGRLTINKAHLTVTADNQSRLYGQADPILTTTVSGFVNSENAASATSGTGSAVTTASSTTNVGNVSITAGIGSLAATNYDFTNFVDGTLTINKVHLIVTADNQSRLYGQANPSLTTTVSGFANSETAATAVSGTGSAVTTASSTTNVGNVSITAGVGSLAATNYDFTNFVDGTLTINKAHLTVTADNQSRLYGQTNPSLTTTVSGFANSETAATAVSGTGSAVTTALSTTNVGNVSITAGIGTLAATNYDFTNFVDGTLTINKAHLTVTADNQSRLYGQANPSLTTTVSGFVNSENAASATSGTGSAVTTASSTTNVGNVNISAGAGSLAATNYDFTNLIDGTLTINKAHLTVNADNQSRLYGQANPSFTTTVSGFANNETAATATSGIGSATATAPSTTNVGTADITPYAFLIAKNYDLTNFVKGTLTINKAPLLVTANNQTRYFGAINPTFTESITGFVLGQNLLTSGVTGTAFGNSTATTTTLPGTAVITGSLGTLASTNYYFLAPVNGVMTILKAKK